VHVCCIAPGVMAFHTAGPSNDWGLVPGFQGGAAEFVAQQLDVRLREHLRLRNNLLTEGTPGLSASLSRPLLCLFDRNFELSVVRARIDCSTHAANHLCLFCREPNLSA